MVEIEGAFAAGTLRLIHILRRRIHSRANLVRGFADHDEVIHDFGVQYWVQRLTISIARQTARHASWMGSRQHMAWFHTPAGFPPA